MNFPRGGGYLQLRICNRKIKVPRLPDNMQLFQKGGGNLKLKNATKYQDLPKYEFSILLFFLSFMFRLLHIFTIISYYFYSTAYISLKRNEIRKGKEQNTWCNRNQSFLQCSCVQNGETINYPQCNMISPTMHTRWHSVYV